MALRTQILICGAGIAGLSSAYHLATRYGVRDILVADPLPPLSLTSDKSTECYRNWWPDEAMVALTNRSIDLMELLADESGNRFHLNRRGYLYLTANATTAYEMESMARNNSRLGCGELRIHRNQPGDPDYQSSPLEGYSQVPVGADLFLAPELIHKHFPGLSSQVKAGLHVRRAGWFSAQQLGMIFLEQARASGVRLVQAKVTEIIQAGGKISGVQLSDGTQVACEVFINAAGPAIAEVGSLLGISLPVYCELHQKVAIRDPLKIVPRAAPLLIWNDPQSLPWTAEEREILKEDLEMEWLQAEMPPGIHTRPEGGEDSDVILLLWEYHSHQMKPIFPPPLDERYPEIALRGIAAMLPEMRNYFHRSARPHLDGGYYTRTRENRPLIGPLPVGGAFIIGALSGFGLMTACAAGELLAAHVTGNPLPDYAPDFLLTRYDHPQYLAQLDQLDNRGQL